MPDDQIFRRPEPEDESVRDRPEVATPVVDATAPDATAVPDPASAPDATPVPAVADADRQDAAESDATVVGAEAVGADQDVPGATTIVPGGDETAVGEEAAVREDAASDASATSAGPVASVADTEPGTTARTDATSGPDGSADPGEVAPLPGDAEQPTTVRPVVADTFEQPQPSPDRQSTPTSGPAEAAGAGEGPVIAAAVPPPVLPVPPELRAPAVPEPDGSSIREAEVEKPGESAVASPSAPAAARADSGDPVAAPELAAPTGPAPAATAIGDSTTSRTAAESDGSPEPATGAAASAEAGAPAASPVADDPAPGTEPPPSRTFRDWLRPDLRQTVIAILLAVFSFAVVTQVRARDQVDSYSTLRQSDLVAMLDGLNQESQRLESELASLQQAQAELESGQDSEELARAQAEERLTSLGILAGTLPAQGPGITLTISDPQRNVKPSMLLDAIEEMRDAGAEAIQVNDTIRVVASSWVSSGSSGIIIDGQAVSVPITIDVIGDPHSLEEAARFRGGLVSQITDSRVGGQVSIVRSDNLVISALHRQQAPRYARPDESAEGEEATTGD